MVQDDGRTLRPCQVGKASPPFNEIDVRRSFFRCVARVVDAIVDECRFRVAVRTARSIAAQIESDRPHPRAQLKISDAIRVVRTQRPIDANERLLSHVLSILPAAGELEGTGVDAALERSHEIREGAIAIGREAIR